MADPTLGSPGVAGTIDDPTQAADNTPQPVDYDEPEKAEDDPQEQAFVKKWWDEWEEGRKFDENFRQQVAIDRRYAAGTADMTWAVSTNVIGAFIDVLTALLYARDPDVSISRAEAVDDTAITLLNGAQLPPEALDAFARTLQIVISKLWKKGKLRRACKKGVRSVLSNAEGWFKCTMVAEKQPQPQTETALNDARETLRRLKATEELLEDGSDNSTDAEAAEKAEIQEMVEELEGKLELAITRMFIIDFVRTENIQVSNDVESIEEYLDAEWIGNEIFMLKSKALAQFPRLKSEDLESAKMYYRHPPKKKTTRDMDNVLPQGQLTAESSLAFSTNQSNAETKPYFRVVEIWDRITKHVRTMIDGVDKWAVEPYEPPYPTSRFYPYFYFSFFEVDGERHAQSLSWRLYKLQDEYSTARSNFRLTRERSIPGVLFNAGGLNPEEARKLENAKHQAYTALLPTDPDMPIGNLFAPKPVAQVDMRVFDTTAITSDMERISGVQEALSAVAQGPGNPQTATEASIQQQGTNARTTSDRDSLEWMLTDLAEYTAQQALQCLTPRDAQRLAGMAAFWPAGMSIEDLFTLVEISIEAGTTGKPKAQGNQAEWAQALPQIQEAIMKVQQALAMGNKPLADAITSLMKETLLRFHVETDLNQFIPKEAPPNSFGSGALPPPLLPKVSVALKGEIDPQSAAALVAPDIQRDQMARPPLPAGAPGAPPAVNGPPVPVPAPVVAPGAPAAPPHP